MEKIYRKINTKKIIKNDNGMTTIEACFILPFSFVLICIILATAFYYYNLTAISRAVTGASLVSEYYPELGNDELSKKALEKFKNLTDGKLIYIDDKDILVDVKVEHSKITVRANGEFNASGFIPGANMFGIKNWKIDIAHSSTRMDKASFIRRIYILKDEINQF